MNPRDRDLWAIVSRAERDASIDPQELELAYARLEDADPQIQLLACSVVLRKFTSRRRRDHAVRRIRHLCGRPDHHMYALRLLLLLGYVPLSAFTARGNMRKFLFGAARNPRAEYRANATLALGRLARAGDPTAAKALLDLANDPVKTVKENARLALSRARGS